MKVVLLEFRYLLLEMHRLAWEFSVLREVSLLSQLLE